MFDEVPGYPKGHRVIANILTSVPRINVALGLPPEASEMELIQWWRNYMKHAPSHKPRQVNGGPLLDNVFEGEDINIEKIPTPVWHEKDGGPFIGTACLVVMKDPDSGVGELRHLPRPVAEAECGKRDDVTRQARSHHHEQVPRAQSTVSGRRHCRNPSSDVHARGARNSVRQERD
jgi:3-polyprenyl-4-hydroxybenzoate decarboxylase and related decarboxylases